MSKLRKGHKQNSLLNGEWAAHVRKSWKKITSGLRRALGKKIIRDSLNE